MSNCHRCKGDGVDPECVPICCGRCTWECGGSGCTGPDPGQQPCRDCGGSGFDQADESAIDAQIEKGK